MTGTSTIDDPDDDVLDREEASEFTAGKQSPEAAEPQAIARDFLRHRAMAVSEEVSADTVLARGIREFRSDEAKLSEMLRSLVTAKVLSEDEAKASGDAKAKKNEIAMLIKIGEHADILLHPKILPLLQPGHSVLYQLVKLYEDLEDGDE